MKKIIFIILAVVLILGIGIGLYYYKFKIVKLAIEDILPKQPMAYIHICDIEKGLKEFKSSRLWFNIKDIDIEKLMQASDVSQEQIVLFRKTKSDFINFISELSLNQFFGQEIAFAVYPTRIGAIDPEAVFAAASNIIIVTRVKPDAEFKDFISKLYGKVGGEVKISKEEYKNQEVNQLALTDKISIAYTKIKDLLVIALGKDKIFACLDAAAKDKLPLSEDKDYSFVRSKLPESAQIIAYGNLGLFFSNLKDLLEIASKDKPETFEEKVDISEIFEKTAGFKTIGFAHSSAEIAKQKIVLIFDKSKMEPLVAKVYSFKPEENKTINFIPKDVIGYQWANSFDLESSWDSLKKEQGKIRERHPEGSSPEEAIKAFENNLGMSIEQVFAALGNEIGGFLSDIDLNGPFPIPQFLIFVKVNDRSVPEGIIDKLTVNSIIPLQLEDYKDCSIRYLLLPFGASLQPSYCYLNDYLLISISRDLIKQSIDAFNNKSVSLLSDKDFQAINLGLTEKNNSIFFLKTDVLLKKIQGICEWAVSWMYMMDSNFGVQQQDIKKKITILKIDIRQELSGLKRLKIKFQSLKEEIISLQKQGQDFSSKRKDLDNLKAKIKNKVRAIKLTRKNLQQIKDDLEKAKQKSLQVKKALPLVRLYLDEVIYPVFDGLSVYKASGSRAIFSENLIEMHSFSKIQK